MSRAAFALLLLPAALQTAPQGPPPQVPQPPVTPVESAPAAPSQPAVVDPAAVTFSSDVGLLLVAVKPGAVADYEAAIVALQGALAKTENEELKALAQGWRVFKANEPDAKTNALYVHLLQPTRKDADYRPSLLLDQLLAGAPAELLAKYRDSFAVAPTKLALEEFAHMAVAPVPKPADESEKEPVTPDSPKTPASTPVKPPATKPPPTKPPSTPPPTSKPPKPPPG